MVLTLLHTVGVIAYSDVIGPKPEYACFDAAPQWMSGCVMKLLLLYDSAVGGAIRSLLLSFSQCV